MKKFWGMWFPLLVLAACTGGDGSTEDNGPMRTALKSLGVQKGNPNLCVLTNAPYVLADDGHRKAYLDILFQVTGCSERMGNLLSFYRPSKSPLITAFFHKKSGSFVVMHSESSKEKSASFRYSREALGTEEFWMNMLTLLDHPDAYSIVSILGSCWLDAPRDFLKTSERHGHVCPGLVFGYFMAKTFKNNYPLQRGESILFVANNPTFCGNDAYRTVLDVTEKNQNIFLKEFSGSQNNWSIHNGAGVLIRWDTEKKQGRGVILGMDMSKLRQLTEFKKPSEALEEMTPAVLSLIPFLNRPENFVTKLWEGPVGEDVLEKLKTSDSDPYKVVGWE